MDPPVWLCHVYIQFLNVFFEMPTCYVSSHFSHSLARECTSRQPFLDLVLVPEFVLGILRSLLHLALYITLAGATSASCNIAACGNRKQSIAPCEGRYIRNTMMESVTKNVMFTLKVEASTVLIGRSCRAGGSRASDAGRDWEFRLRALVGV